MCDPSREVGSLGETPARAATANCEKIPFSTTAKQPLPVILSSEKHVLGVTDILLSHFESWTHGRTQICPKKQENGPDPKTTPRTGKHLVKGHRSSLRPRREGHPRPPWRTRVSLLNTAQDMDHRLPNSPPRVPELRPLLAPHGLAACQATQPGDERIHGHKDAEDRTRQRLWRRWQVPACPERRTHHLGVPSRLRGKGSTAIANTACVGECHNSPLCQRNSK